MIRTLTSVLALGAVALTCAAAVADVPAPGALPAPPATTASPTAPAAAAAPPASPTAATAPPGTRIVGLQAKIVTVNPRLTHHKGRQLRVFVRNRGPSASAHGAIWLRTRPGQQPAFVTEARPLPAIAPGGEVSRTFSVPRYLRALPPLSRLEAVVNLQGVDMILQPFANHHAAPRPALPVFPNPAHTPALPR